jgi:hypothetical protein
MKQKIFSFPEWINDCQVSDNLFGDAYENTPARFRAWMKTEIAKLWNIYEAESPSHVSFRKSWNSGFSVEQTEIPDDVVILAFDSKTVSPVRILAALVPALVSGVKNIIAVHIGDGEISSSVLAAFELSGQERVVSVSVDSFHNLIEACCCDDFSTVVLDLCGAGPVNIDDKLNIKYWRNPEITKIALCSEITKEIHELISFIHPDLDIIETSPTNLKGFYVAIVQDELLPGYKPKLILKSGHEGCWIWHSLTNSIFKSISFTFSD